jgi:hypothetical protein
MLTRKNKVVLQGPGFLGFRFQHRLLCKSTARSILQVEKMCLLHSFLVKVSISSCATQSQREKKRWLTTSVSSPFFYNSFLRSLLKTFIQTMLIGRPPTPLNLVFHHKPTRYQQKRIRAHQVTMHVAVIRLY